MDIDDTPPMPRRLGSQRQATRSSTARFVVGGMDGCNLTPVGHREVSEELFVARRRLDTSFFLLGDRLTRHTRRRRRRCTCGL